MSFITLFSDEWGLVATDQRVFSAQELQPLLSVVDQASELNRRLSIQSKREQAATEAASQQGYSDGLSAGKQEAAVQQAGALRDLQAQYQNQVTSMQSNCAELAVEIVRKIAGQAGSEDWLLALACQGASELVDHPQVTLRVHADQANALRARIDDLPHCRIDSVVSDELLAPDACVLETVQGQIEVDMETQLGNVLALFSEEDAERQSGLAATCADAV